MAAPVFVVSGVIAAAPALITASQSHQAAGQTIPRTVMTHLDAVVQPAAPATLTYTTQAGAKAKVTVPAHHGHQHHHKQSSSSSSSATTPVASPGGTGGQSSAGSGGTGTPSSGGTGAGTSTGTSTATSSSGVSTAVQSDIASGNNLLAVGQFLVDNGYSKAAAAGVASCIDGESGGNPESVGSGGGGLIGWTPLSSARPDSDIVTGNRSQDMMAQLTDLLFYNSNEIGQAQVAELNSQTNPVAAADFYSQDFEKPAVRDSDVRASVADQVFSELGG
jgi:hypothetical protein